jgi:hypothetical protein
MLKSLISTAVVISAAFLISNKAIADDVGIEDRLKQL